MRRSWPLSDASRMPARLGAFCRNNSSVVIKSVRQSNPTLKSEPTPTGHVNPVSSRTWNVPILDRDWLRRIVGPRRHGENSKTVCWSCPKTRCVVCFPHLGHGGYQRLNDFIKTSKWPNEKTDTADSRRESRCIWKQPRKRWLVPATSPASAWHECAVS